MEFETLETERLILKKLTPEIIAHLFAHYAEADIKKELGLTTDAEFNKEKEKFDGGYTTYDRTIVTFVLIRKDTNQSVGRAGFHNWYKDHRKAEIGYALNSDENKRKGFMGEAVRTIIAYGFETMDLNRIEACVGPANVASLRLIQKNGFTKEGHLRQHYIRDNEIQDSLIFSLLRQEYKK
jgi:ribosomal-protein-alanine N-acetyltransferase